MTNGKVGFERGNNAGNLVRCKEYCSEKIDKTL